MQCLDERLRDRIIKGFSPATQEFIGRAATSIDGQFFFRLSDFSCMLCLTLGTSESIMEYDLARVIHGGIGTLNSFKQGV